MLVPAGCQLDHYRRNPVVFWNHQGGDGLPIASAEDPQTGKLAVAITQNAVKARAWFDKGNPFAMEIYRLVSKRFLRATSIGFMPLETKSVTHKDGVSGFLIPRWELLEFSIVGVPSNPEALSQELRRGYSPAVCKAIQAYRKQNGENTTGWRPDAVEIKLGELLNRVQAVLGEVIQHRELIRADPERDEQAAKLDEVLADLALRLIGMATNLREVIGPSASEYEEVHIMTDAEETELASQYLRNKLAPCFAALKKMIYGITGKQCSQI